MLIDTVFSKLQIRTAIKLNNRKVLSGIAEIIGEADKIIDITVAIDKIDKIGIDNVVDELRSKELSEEAINRLRPLLELSGSNEQKLQSLKAMLAESETGLKGIEELESVIDGIESIGHQCDVELDVSLARGLNYYTGTIIEVKALDVEIGSITGGGRYDNLTGVFGMSGLSGVGISFGADRIYDVLNQLDLYPSHITSSVKVMFVNFGQAEAMQSAKYIARLRGASISAELYPDAAKMKKQMSYADDNNIPYVAIIGESELENGTIALKNMISGEQQSVTIDELIQMLGL